MKKKTTIFSSLFLVTTLSSCNLLEKPIDDVDILRNEYNELYDRYNSDKTFTSIEDMEVKLQSIYEENKYGVVMIKSIATIGSDILEDDESCAGFVFEDLGADSYKMMTSKRCYSNLDYTNYIYSEFQPSYFINYNEITNQSFPTITNVDLSDDYVAVITFDDTTGNNELQLGGKYVHSKDGGLTAATYDVITTSSENFNDTSYTGSFVVSMSNQLGYYDSLGSLSFGVMSSLNYLYENYGSAGNIDQYGEDYVNVRVNLIDHDADSETPMIETTSNESNKVYKCNTTNCINKTSSAASGVTSKVGPNFIQHNAAVTSGHEGSPLFNLDGDLIGMSFAKEEVYDYGSNRGIIPESISYAIEVQYLKGLM